ncbi:MAG: PEP-CTERM sorting domain-containing protein [Phycisphaerales bacterium]
MMNRTVQQLLGIAALLAAGASAPAATYYWDTDGNASNTGAGAYGGNGAWDTTSSFWNTANNGSGSLTTWNAAPNTDVAAFGVANTNTDATVTVPSDIYAGQILFTAAKINPSANTTFYNLSGSVIHLSGGWEVLKLASNNVSATINNVVELTGASGAGIEINLNTSGLNGHLTLAGGLNNTGAANRDVQLDMYNGTGIDFTGDITKSGTGGLVLKVGANTGNFVNGNAMLVRLNGNNTGLAGAALLKAGTLLLNHSNALGGSVSLTLTNPVTTASAVGDTSKLLIGTAGVSISTPLIVANTTAADTADIRVIGSNITTGTATYTGPITLGDLQGLANGLELSAASGGTTAFNGAISDGANSSKITVNGGGTVNLANPTGNLYDGGTTVTGNTSLVVSNTSGSATGTGAVVIATGSKLGGNGSVSGPVTGAGNIAPGNSIGTLTVGSAAISGTFSVELQSAGVSDLLTVVGNLDITNTTLGLTDLGGALDGSTYIIATYGSLTGSQFFAVDPLLDANGYTVDYNYQGGNQIALVIPEPATLGLMTLGGMMIATRRNK